MASGQTKYTPGDGTRELKLAVQEKFRRENGLRYGLDQITVGTGAKQILYNAFMATLDGGDEVIVPVPAWLSYMDMVAICGGTPVQAICAAQDSFRLTPAALESAITPRTRWLVLNSPSNPTGAAYREDELRALAEVLKGHPQVWIIADDIYEHIVYDGFRCTTFAQAAPSLMGRTLTVNGVSKAYAMTGWRIGYAAGPRPLIEAMAIVQSQATTCPSSISQAAAVAALTGSQDLIAERAECFQRRRDLVVSGLNGIDVLHCGVPEGAFYAFPSCASVIGRTTLRGRTITDDAEFCRYLLDEYDLAVVPGAAFGMSPFLAHW